MGLSTQSITYSLFDWDLLLLIYDFRLLLHLQLMILNQTLLFYNNFDFRLIYYLNDLLVNDLGREHFNPFWLVSLLNGLLFCTALWQFILHIESNIIGCICRQCLNNCDVILRLLFISIKWVLWFFFAYWVVSRIAQKLGFNPWNGKITKEVGSAC